MPLPDDFYDRYPHLREEDEDPWDAVEVPPPPQVLPPRRTSKRSRASNVEAEFEPEPSGKPFTLDRLVVHQLWVGPLCCAVTARLSEESPDAPDAALLLLFGVFYFPVTLLQFAWLRRDHPGGSDVAAKFLFAAVAFYLLAVYATVQTPG